MFCEHMQWQPLRVGQGNTSGRKAQQQGARWEGEGAAIQLMKQSAAAAAQDAAQHRRHTAQQSTAKHKLHGIVRPICDNSVAQSQHDKGIHSMHSAHLILRMKSLWGCPHS